MQRLQSDVFGQCTKPCQHSRPSVNYKTILVTVALRMTGALILAQKPHTPSLRLCRNKYLEKVRFVRKNSQSVIMER